MEKLQEISNGNANVKNVYFGFEKFFPDESQKKNNSEIIAKKTKKSKKTKSKSKSKNKSKKKENNNTFNQIKIIKEENYDNSKYLAKGNKYSKKPVKIIKTDEEKEKEYLEEKNKKKNLKKKKKSKSKSKSKIKEEYIIESETDEIKNKSKSKKKKKKSEKKEKEKEKKEKSKSKGKKSKKSKNKKSKEKIKIKKENENEKNIITDDYENEKTNDLYDYNIEIKEIKDDAMNEVTKHIHSLTLGFNNNMNIIGNKANNKLKKQNNNKFNNTNILNNKYTNNNTINLNNENETFYKRPYTAHGFKVKSKNKKLSKTIRNKNDEEEKIIAYKEKVLVHDKILSLYNNFKIKEIRPEKEFSKTNNPRVNSAYTLKNKKFSEKHYMKPREKDIKKIKKRNIIYFNDKPEEDPEELKINKNEENEIKKKNDKAIKLIKSSNKYFNKSNQALSDLKNVLNKENMETFMNNFMLKNNFTLNDEDSKIHSNNYFLGKNIKYYHGGKIYRRIKLKSPRQKNKLNNSDNHIEKKRKYKLFNPKEIISNPNNKFNFFSQTFTKQPIYGKYYEPPKEEKLVNENLGYIETNKWNGRYKIKKYKYEEKENPNDVYNYDFKYDDLNSDSDYELPSTNFKARAMPKYKNVNIQYKDIKTGKIKGRNNKIENNKIEEYNEFQDNGGLDKNIYHPFLVNDDIF